MVELLQQVSVLLPYSLPQRFLPLPVVEHLLLVVAVVGLGVKRGLGLLVWVAVPILLVLLGVLVMFALEYGDVKAAQDFLFSVQLIDFSRESVVVAMGHAFFTLGVGVGAGITYGAYAPDRIPVGRSVRVWCRQVL